MICPVPAVRRFFPPLVAMEAVKRACERPEERGRSLAQWDSAEIARSLWPRLGLSANETTAVAWLVKNHLVMSDTAQRRDVSDPKTVRDFVDMVQSPEMLRLLVILTVADIRAVGPGVWERLEGPAAARTLLCRR